ncbi:MAG: 3-deoxy-D-manno-octulosonic acid transferase [Candidatus Omnitrophica bacterium]|nr:3-deoxy-D-manno-octulosonic acid transferase [Candidatus Omnitrophota bacterium]
MLYGIAFFIFSVFYIPTLIFKGKLHKDFLERFGIYGDAKEEALRRTKEVIWIEAVSVGEVALCKSFIPLLKREHPERSIVLSTITRTGNDLARKLFSGDAVVIYFPLDFSYIARRVIRKIHPKLYIMIETEIWPNVLTELRYKRVPSILINGRISDRSFGKYRLVRGFLSRVLKNIAVFCMQSDADAGRIMSLGAASDRVKVTGNMKFDADLVISDKSAAGVKELFGFKAGDEIFVAGSTHGGEEETVVSVYKELTKSFPDLKLVIAPRHVERAPEVENIVKRLGLEAVRMPRERDRSSSGPDLRGPSAPPGVLIIDAIGYLNEAYSIAEIVFVGGSLIPHGGQNPIEPAVFGKPVIFGPYMFNFKAVTSALLKGSGALQVKDQKEFLLKADQLLKDKERRATFGRNARNIISENRGATSRNLEAIKGLIND